jgi:hypothetical protein
VTDPPAGIGFMGKEWDKDKGGRDKWIAWLAGILRQCRWLMRPGAYGWVWAIPRTSHWTAMACEDAGFAVRDVMTHVFGCLTEDAELLTATGWKKYTDIQVGDLTLGLAPDGAFIWQPVRQVHTYDHEQIAYRVHSANTDHIVTAGHRMLVGNADGWAIRTADEVASQREVRVPTIQDLPALLSAIPVPQSASGCTKQVLYPDLCRAYTETGLEKAETCLQTLFENFSTEEPSCTRQSEVLQLQVSNQILSAKPRYEIDRRQRESGLDGSKLSLLPREDERRQEPSVEGWSNPVSSPRQLFGCAVCTMPTGVSEHGSTRWICDGAPSDRCSTVGSVSYSDRGSTSHQSQPQRQQDVQSDALQIELRPQTFRGSRYAVADLARIEPVFYRGKVWCVEVPSGVFIARRKGLVFLTGNTGFPKSRSCLKPSAEHWILIKAPGELRELRIEENRIEGTKESGSGNLAAWRRAEERDDIPKAKRIESTAGRWPANFALSHCDDCADTCVEDCPVRLLDEQSGELKSGAVSHKRGSEIKSTWRVNEGRADAHVRSNDSAWPSTSGGASRFFYQAKPSTKERSLGLPDRNTHPTVKSIALMRHLIRLIAAPDSLILDPFTGSGSTAVAAIEEGCRFVGIEQDPQHAETARLRAQHALGGE